MLSSLFFHSDTLQELVFVCPTALELCFYRCCHPCLFRFWFENAESEIFTAEEIEEIRNIRLWDVIVNATNVKPYEIQKEVIFYIGRTTHRSLEYTFYSSLFQYISKLYLQVFKWREGDPCGQPKQLAHQDMKPCIHHEKFDYFMVSNI